MSDNLFGNNNRKVISHLAKNSVTHSKMRNLFIVLTIALSVSLLMVMALTYTGQMVVERKELSSTQHVIYHNVDTEQIAGLRSDPYIEDLMLVKWGPAVEVEDYIIWSLYFDDSAAIIESIQIGEGSIPIGLNEVAVDRQFLERLGIEPELGVVIPVTFLDGSTESFTVTAFLDEEDPGNVFYLSHSKEYADHGAQLQNVSYNAPVRILNAEDMSASGFKEFIISLGAKYDIPQRDVNDNGYFIEMLEGDPSTLTAIIGLGMLFLLVSVLVVYSVFYLSVISRIRQFGQMRTIGMTQRQIRKMVTREGLLLCAIGAPIGVIAGGIIGYALNPAGWSWINSAVVALIAVLADIVTVLVSLHRPARMAASISPIEAARHAEGSSHKKSRSLRRPLTPFNLAKMNFYHNRKKTLLTIISLGVGGVLMLASTTFLISHDREAYSRQKELYYGEYAISFAFNPLASAVHGVADFQLNNPMGETFKERLLSITGVTGIRTFLSTDVHYEYKDITEPNSVAPFDQEEYPEITALLADAPTYDDLLNGNQLIIVGNSTAQEIFGWEFEVGDIIPIQFWNGDQSFEVEFTIAACADRNRKHSMNGGWFLIPEETLTKLLPGFDLTQTVIVQGDYQDVALNEALQAIVDESPLLSMITLTDRMKADISFFNSFYRLVMGLCCFIIGFSVINLLNTLISSIVSRRQEFALLQSVGMGDRQLTRMIQYEGLLIAAANMVISLTIGGLLGYAAVSIMRSIGVSYLQYTFPIIPVVAYTIFALSAPILISSLAMKALKKQTLVERLRKDG